MEDVIEESDRISARFTYNGTFTKPFMGYRPNSVPIQLRSIDIWRVKDGKFVEHWTNSTYWKCSSSSGQ
jgi:predicted ester cyclase